MQRAAIQRWADANGIDEVIWFEDLGVSGLFERNRAGWQQLLDELSKNDPNVVGLGIYNYTKSHRNVRDFLNFYDNFLAPLGKRLIDVSNPYLDLSTADGRMLGTIQMSVAEAHARRTSEQMAETVYHIQTVQNRHFGPLPFGCQRDADKHLIASEKYYWLDPTSGDAWRGDDLPVPANAEKRYYYDALHALASTHADGRHSYQDTAMALNAAGWRNWDGDKTTPTLWTRQSVRSVARHWQLYAGDLPPSPTTPIKRNRERAVLPGGHKPILPLELCQQLGAAYNARSVIRDPGHNNRGEHHYILSGLLICQCCGQRLGGQQAKRGQKHHYYYRHQYGRGECKEPYIPAIELEGQVIGALAQIIQHHDVIARLMETLRRNLAIEAAENDAGAQALLKLEEKREELERLVDLYTTKRITLEQFDRREAALKAQIAELEKSTATLADLADAEVHLERLLLQLGRLQEAEPDLQRYIIRAFIERIEIKGGKISRCQPVPWAARFFECVNLGLSQSLEHTLHLDILEWLS